MSDKGKDFISKLLTHDMNARPSAAEALNHPWVAELAPLQVESKMAITALENLHQFRAGANLKKATFAFIASQLLSKEEHDQLSKVFKALDKEGDGRLSFEEVKAGYLEHNGIAMADEEV